MEMDDKKKRRSLILYFLIGAGLIFGINQFVAPKMRSTVIEPVPYSTFIAAIDEGKVTEVEVQDGNKILFRTSEGGQTKAYEAENTYGKLAPEVQNKLQDQKITYGATISDSTNTVLITYMVLSYLLPIAIFLYVGWRIKKRMQSMGDDMPSMTFGGGGMGLGKSGAKVIEGQETGVTFKDVAGQDEAKRSLTEIVDFLEKPERYTAIGAKLPRGALLVGPPGTGKTLLAKAVAGEAGVPFFSMSGSEFVEMFVGRGAAKVRDLFKQANEKAPCIVFIDEIDTIGKKRGAQLQSNDEREQTLNQLLTEMDGFDNHKGIVVLAATNRPDVLDPALLRPGRFDRRIPVELPDFAGRKAILSLHAGDVKMEKEIDLDIIARMTPGASGADLSNIINEAALRAVRLGRNKVNQEDIVESVEVVIAGEKRKSTVLNAHEKRVVAYHEIGHAIVAASQKGSAPVSKITIVPRTSGALGYTMQVEEDEKFLTTKKEAQQKIAVLCGGRAAEELIFGEVTTGASNDIEKATQIARNMVTRFGMSDKFGMVALGTVRDKYLGGGSELTCSEGIAQEVDREVINIVEDAHKEALHTLQTHKFKLHELASYLEKKETITGDEFMAIFTRDDGFKPNLPKTE